MSKLAELANAPGFGAAVEMLTGGIGHHVKQDVVGAAYAAATRLVRRQARAEDEPPE